MLIKVISGGQTGVDQAALRAARKVGLATGGTAPKGWETLDGSAPWLVDFGLVECPRPGYPPRTEFNVVESDATLRIARNFSTPGEILTMSLCEKHKKPSLSIVDFDLWSASLEGMIYRLARFVYDWNIHTLNVAGNAEQHAKGIGTVAENYLVRAFSKIRGVV